MNEKRSSFILYPSSFIHEEEMYRFTTFTRSLALIHLRNRMVLFWNLLFPVMMLILYGTVFTPAATGAPEDFNFINWVLPGVLVFNALAFGLLTSSTMMMTMRELGVLRRLQATPMPAGQLIGAYLLVNVTIVLLQSLVIILVAVLFFDATVTAAGLLLALPMLLVGIVTFVALGQVVSGVAQTAGIALILGQIAYWALLFVTDMIMPLEVMPAWIQRVGVYLPSYAVVQLVRPPLLEGALDPNLGRNLLLATVYIVLAGVAAARLFRWSPRS
jgi:ABC-2 type transport system permease protein